MKKIILTLAALLFSMQADAYTVNGNLNVWAGNVAVYSDAGSTLKFKVDKSTGSFGIPSTSKFYLDGTALSGDTYLKEESSNIVDFTVGGVNDALRIGTSTLAIPATSKFYLDGGSDTYIQESSNNVIGLFENNANVVSFGNGNEFWGLDDINATAQLFINYHGYHGGSTQFRDTIIGDGKADQIALFTSDRVALGVELSLPNIDPPTPNYANRNGIVKGWANVASNAALNASYNVSSATNPSTGIYVVNWGTDFASSNYAVVVTPVTPLLVYTSNSSGATTVGCRDTTNTLTSCAFSIMAIGTQ